MMADNTISGTTQKSITIVQADRVKQLSSIISRDNQLRIFRMQCMYLFDALHTRVTCTTNNMHISLGDSIHADYVNII